MATTTIQSGSPIASFGDSYMPSLSDAADIQTALKALYFGSTGAANTSNGIYGALYTLYTGSPTLAGNVTITGNLTVNGATTTINSTTLNVDDKLIELGAVASPTDATANGGGISLLGTTNKTILFDNANANWTTSENWNITSGKTIKINNTTVLSSTQVFGRTPAGTSAGDIATIDATQTLTNKTLTSPVISSIVNSGTLTLPTSTDQLIGRATTDTLSNKTLTTPIIASISNSGTLTVPTGGGTIATTANIDTAINTLQKIQFFGDGSDGNVTVSTTVTLNRDMYYNNLTITTGGKIITNGWRVHVSGILDVTAAQINAFTAHATGLRAMDGGNAVNSTQGAAGTEYVTTGIISGMDGTAGGVGLNNTPGTGGAGGNLANTTSVFPNGVYIGAVGGAGTPGSGSAGGAAGTQTTPTILFGPRRAWVDWTPLAAGRLKAAAGGTGGGGGSSTGGGGLGGGGGGGGAGCFGLAIYANTINRSAVTATSFINMVGGFGGTGAAGTATAGSGGGGAGGQGGFVYIVYGTLTGASKTAAIKTTGGTGGNGGGSATGGAGGASGVVILVDLFNGTISFNGPSSGTTPGAGNPVGGTAGNLTVNL